MNSSQRNNELVFPDPKKYPKAQYTTNWKNMCNVTSYIMFLEYAGAKFPSGKFNQPEDNLDSQYIYKNLVRQLRDIKNKRQIIIATHSATIVTNAMADQVCVMCSDGENGWIERAGYPSEDTIKRDIVNYMEGGIDSFEHKIKVYQPILKNEV